MADTHHVPVAPHHVASGSTAPGYSFFGDGPHACPNPAGVSGKEAGGERDPSPLAGGVGRAQGERRLP